MNPSSSIGDTNPVNMSVSYNQGIESSAEPTLEPSAIPYNDNQLADSDLGNGLFVPISLLRINKFISSDVQNMTYLLLRIGTFIKQCKNRV